MAYVVPCVRFNDVVRSLTAEICIPVSRLIEVAVVPSSMPRFSLTMVYLQPVLAFSFITATLGTNGWLDLVRQRLALCKKRQASLGARRGREGSYPPSPRTDPCVRNYRTGLFRNTRFRMITYSATNCLFPVGRFAQIRQPCMSGLCFLCELRIPVSSFPK